MATLLVDHKCGHRGAYHIVGGHAAAYADAPMYAERLCAVCREKILARIDHILKTGPLK
jgi:hypothetical protein